MVGWWGCAWLAERRVGLSVVSDFGSEREVNGRLWKRARDGLVWTRGRSVRVLAASGVCKRVFARCAYGFRRAVLPHREDIMLRCCFANWEKWCWVAFAFPGGVVDV